MKKLSKEEILALGLTDYKSNKLKNNNGCVDCPHCYGCDACTSCTDCQECDNCNNCQECSNCSYCYECRNCDNCIGCKGIDDGEYMIQNIQVTQTEYETFIGD